jgi:hypothetical protein
MWLQGFADFYSVEYDYTLMLHLKTFSRYMYVSVKKKIKYVVSSMIIMEI